VGFARLWPMNTGPLMDGRGSGVLLHVTSLPGGFGVGDLGPVAWEWLEMLAAAGQGWWQVLPLGPNEGSPYSSYSAFAGNPLLISPEALTADGLLKRADLPPAPASRARADFRRAARVKGALLNLAFERFVSTKHSKLRTAYDRFVRASSHWLDDYALFVALKRAYPERDWRGSPRGLARRQPDALATARRELAPVIEREMFVQFIFFRQLDALRAHAAHQGVRLIGDLPIFICDDSADVWANPHLFQLDRSGRCSAVAGCPPDMFSETGQRWGNPLYDWEAMARDGFAWWVARLRQALRQADVVRIDHFRGFEAYWRIPARSATAKSGKWTKAPGHALFARLKRELKSLPFIAEDLGVITPEVERLRDAFQLPGMRVLQFAFDGSDNVHVPHHHVRNAVAYTGTHDNDTTVGWYRSLGKPERARVKAYLPGITSDRDAARAVLRATWASVANLAIAPMQDVLGLDSRARMNTPGTMNGNWAWRLTPEALSPRALAELAELTATYGRWTSRPS
jgi:4-alpha-glucanotransferase